MTIKINEIADLMQCQNCGSNVGIAVLHPPIGGHHPVPCFSTQITERQGTVMY